MSEYNQLQSRLKFKQFKEGLSLLEESIALQDCQSLSQEILACTNGILDEVDLSSTSKKIPCMNFCVNRESLDQRQQQIHGPFHSMKLHLEEVKKGGNINNTSLTTTTLSGTKRPSVVTPKGKKKNRKKKEKDSFLPPSPNNPHNKYDIKEAVSILKGLEPKHRSPTIDYWVLHKFIPVKRSSMYEILKDEKKQACWNVDHDSPFSNTKGLIFDGAHRYMNYDQLNLFVSNWYKMEGRAILKADVRKELERLRGEVAETKGLDKDLLPKISDQTVRNYHSFISRMKISTVNNETQQKTENRFIAENSILAAVSYLVTLAANHFIIGTPPAGTIKSEDATEGAQLLDSLVTKANRNSPIYPVFPGMIFSTDEHVSFVFKGVAKKKEEWYVSSSDFNSSTQSTYTSDKGGTDHKNGIRVRQYHTFNALGCSAPILLTVSGLNEREIPINLSPAGVRIIEIPGLCIGSTQDVRHNAIGYLAFMRSTRDENTQKTAEVKLFEFYNKHILLPFIEDCRKKYFHGYKTGDNVLPHMTAVSWNDGALTQMAAITCEENLVNKEKKRVRRCKVHASATAVQQSADLASVFKDMNKEIKKTTAEKIGNVGLKGNIVRILENEAKIGAVDLSYKNKEALIDFLTCYPSMLGKSATCKGVQLGFLSNGQIDTDSHYWPDFHKILKTCKNKDLLKASNIEKIKTHFKQLYEYQVEHGHVPDSVLEITELPKDKDLQGNVVERLATITNEPCQRCKSISHIAVRKERVDELEKVAAKKIESKMEAVRKVRALLQDSDKCIMELKKKNRMAVDESLPSYLLRLRMCDFANQNVRSKLIKAFIHVRKFNTVKATKALPSTKGNVIEAVRERDINLIRMAYDVRMDEIKLKVEEYENLLTHDDDTPAYDATTPILVTADENN